MRNAWLAAQPQGDSQDPEQIPTAALQPELQVCRHPALHGEKGDCGDRLSAEGSGSCGALRCHSSALCCSQHFSGGDITEHKGESGQPCCYSRQQVQQKGCCSSCSSLTSFTCNKQPGTFSFGMCIMILIIFNCCNRRCLSPAFPASHFQALPAFHFPGQGCPRPLPSSCSCLCFCTQMFLAIL